MKIIDKWRERKKLEKMVSHRLEELLDLAETADEIAVVLALKEKANQAKKKSWISPDTVVLALCNLLGILLILNFEKIDVVSSKALGFVSRPKL